MSIISLTDMEKFGEFSTMLSKCEGLGEPITIEICSPGGCVYQSLAYMAKILECPVDITTVAYGQCMSSAVLPFLAGKTRKSSEYCHFMVHEAKLMGEEDTTVTKAKQEADQAMKEEDQYFELLARFTNKKAKWWKAKILGKGDIYISAQEALKLGMVDVLF